MDRPARISGHPNFNGIWQALNTAYWNLEGHSAEAFKDIWQLGAIGAIPAGFAREQQEEAIGCISIDVKTLGVRNRNRIFGLKVRGDSMSGKNILDGDFVIVEQGRTPRTGDVVAALIDNESTLKTLVMKHGKPSLRAENPKYPDLIPASDLSIQGVMVALVRKTR